MERIKTLITRYRRTIFLFFSGLIVIAYIALGVVYLQQGKQQRALQNQINSLNVIPRDSLPNLDILQAKYGKVNQALAPLGDNVSITMLLDVAQKSGLDISEESGKFQVPVASHSSSGSYQTVSFSGIQIQGDPDKVLDFIRVLDSDEMLQPPGPAAPRVVVRAVTRVFIVDTEVTPGGGEGERRAEFRSVSAVVKRMMTDNGLFRLLHPVSFSLGRATNRMGDDPATVGIFEGFPDNTTTAAEKRYTGNATPKQGYLLLEHDKISSDNTTLYSTANYTQTLITAYYYTAEEDGTVRQWSGADVAAATEYSDSKPSKMELKASLDISFYFKPK